MSIVWTQDGTVIVFDSEVGTASGTSIPSAWDKIRLRKADKLGREFLKARDMILAQSRPFR